MSEPSKEAKAWAEAHRPHGYSNWIDQDVEEAFDAGRASATLPPKVLEAVRKYEHKVSIEGPMTGMVPAAQLERNRQPYKIAIADAVLAHLKGEGR